MSLHLMNIMQEEEIYRIVSVYEMLELCCILYDRSPREYHFLKYPYE